MLSGVDHLAHAIVDSWRAYLADSGRCCCDRCVADEQERATSLRWLRARARRVVLEPAP